MRWQDAWIERFYRSRPGWLDGTTEFHRLCSDRIAAGAEILEVGAGPTNPTTRFLASLGHVHGVDVSEEVHGNVNLATSAVLRDGRFPFADASFDAVVSNYVAEHVENPAEHLGEIARVLRSGGRYFFRTPNLFHYVALISRFTPHSFHRLVANRLRALPPDQHDPWPTVYAMNRPASVRRLAAASGFVVERLEMVEKEPSYGMIARPLFLLFAGYERLVNATNLLASFRVNMFVVLRKAT